VTLAAGVHEATVRTDGQAIEGIGVPTALDPGAHLVTLSAPGHDDRTFPVSLAESETRRLTVDFGAERTAVPAAAPGPAPVEKAPTPIPPPHPDAPPSGTRRIAGFIVGGSGLAAIGAGSVFALVATSKKSQSNETCSGNVCGDPGYDLRTDARGAGNVATAFFVAGMVALAAGAILVLWPQADRRAVQSSPGRFAASMPP
jgi:hypothetical protein